MRTAAVWSTIALVCAAGSSAQEARKEPAPAKQPIEWPELGSKEKARARLLLCKLDSPFEGFKCA